MSNRTEPISLWRVQIESAIHLLKVARSSNPNVRTLSRWTAAQLRAMRLVIPYVVHPVSHTNKFILLNRDYLPLGVAVIGFVDYTRWPWAHMPPPPERLLDSANGRLYFFGDGSAPWGTMVGLACLTKRLENFLEAMGR